MKALDVITRLKEIIPRYTALFSDELIVYSLSYAAGVVTCSCAAKHELEVGDELFVKGALTPITINSLTRVGNLVTAITNSNHDLTRDYQETVTISGASPTAYNGEHPLVDVLNRRTFIYSVTSTPTTPATGVIKMVENIAAGYNGLHTVLNVLDDYMFTYAITSAPESPAQGDITLRKNIRITGDVTMGRFLESYSKQITNAFYLVAIMGGANASKDRRTMSDATNTSTSAAVEARIRMIDPFSLFVIAPSSEALTAMTIRDGMDSVLNLLNKCILFYVFSSDTEIQTNLGITFTGHSMYSYDIARYIHEFKYEFTYDLVREDGVTDDESVAFRDIDLYFNSYLDPNHEAAMHTLVDLDDQPLP